MSEQTTYRFFVDNKRVATAVFWKMGSKHMSPILEVFPRQSTTAGPSGRPLMAIFHTENAWREHCLEDYVPKQKSRVETVTKPKRDPKLDEFRRYRTGQTESVTHRFFVGDKHMATAVVYASGILQVFPRLPGSRMFQNIEKWTKHCEEKYNPQPVTRFEVTKKEVKETTTRPAAPAPVFVPKKNWICTICCLGPGNDHRMCICRFFDFSIADWEIAVGIRPPVPSNITPSEPTTTAVAASIALKVYAKQQEAKAAQEEWTHKETHKTTLPAGKYYIGDLCYALADDIYDGVFGNIGGYDSGLYKKNDSEFFFVDNTAYGDGMYGATDGNEFAVDAGIIGICPASMIGKGTGREKDGDGGHIYEFKEPVKCTFNSGVFTFKSGFRKLVINTEGEDEESE